MRIVKIVLFVLLALLAACFVFFCYQAEKELYQFRQLKRELHDIESGQLRSDLGEIIS